MTEQPALATIRAALAADRQNLKDAIKRVPVGLLEQRPATDRWSVAEVVEHLAVVEAGTVALLAPLVESAPLLPPGEQPAPTPIPREMLRDRSTRVSAPEAIQPKGVLGFAAALAALEQGRERLLTVLAAAEGRDLRVIGRTHPRFGQIDGYQCFALVGAHEERHALQILEIAAQLATNPA